MTEFIFNIKKMNLRLNGRLLILSCSLNLVLYISSVDGSWDKSLSKLSLRLYLGDDPDDGDHCDVFIDDAVNLLDKFNENSPTVIYIHGFTENLGKESVRTVVSAYLKRKDHNVVAVDWSEIASQNYVAVAFGVEGVGKTLARALNDMVKASLDPDGIHVVGHSLGGQVAGFVGRNVDFELRRITALDPAGPGFYFFFAHLNHKDAKFVDVIHTDYGIYGYGRPTGTVDFFPNGGTRIQPGCPKIFIPFSTEDFCSHFRSWAFYAESLLDEKAFIGVECPSRLKFQSNECANDKKVPMGIATPFGTKGLYYLATNDQKPYGRGEKGVNSTSKSFLG